MLDDSMWSQNKRIFARRVTYCVNTQFHSTDVSITWAPCAPKRITRFPHGWISGTNVLDLLSAQIELRKLTDWIYYLIYITTMNSNHGSNHSLCRYFMTLAVVGDYILKVIYVVGEMRYCWWLHQMQVVHKCGF